MEVSKNNINDHDRLIRIDTRLEDLIKTVGEIRDGTTLRISDLEKEKADRKELDELQKKSDDREIRIRDLESYRSTYLTMTIIYAGIGASMIGLILWHIFSKN